MAYEQHGRSVGPGDVASLNSRIDWTAPVAQVAPVAHMSQEQRRISDRVAELRHFLVETQQRVALLEAHLQTAGFPTATTTSPTGYQAPMISANSICHGYVGSKETLLRDCDHCMICLEKFEEGEALRSLRCIHTFHLGCIDRWLAEKEVCPVCRLNISPNSPENPPAAREFGPLDGITRLNPTTTHPSERFYIPRALAESASTSSSSSTSCTSASSEDEESSSVDDSNDES